MARRSRPPLPQLRSSWKAPSIVHTGALALVVLIAAAFTASPSPPESASAFRSTLSSGE